MRKLANEPIRILENKTPRGVSYTARITGSCHS